MKKKKRMITVMAVLVAVTQSPKWSRKSQEQLAGQLGNSTGRYRTRQFSAIFESDSELRYQDEIHGSLISRADKVVDLIFTKYLKADISYQGVTRVETCPFPKEAIREEPSLSQKKIADVIGEKYSTVKYYMESMKKSGIIKREGSSQKGKWIIL